MANNLLASADPIRKFVVHYGRAKVVPSFEVTTMTLRLYKYMSAFMFVAVVLLSATQFFGHPIHCFLQKEVHIDRKLADAYCWTTGVYTIANPHQAALSLLGSPSNPPAQGVIPEREAHSKRKHIYYQWVFLVLLVQGIFCYLPYTLWKHLEGHLMGRVALKDIFADKLESREAEDLVEEFRVKRRQFPSVFGRYLFCLVVGMTSLLVQMAAVDTVVGGGGFFWRLGLGLSNLEFLFQNQDDASSNAVDPLAFLFPRLVKCSMSYYAFNGPLQEVDALCLLPHNILNEKVYTILWFAFWIIFAWTLASMLGYLILRISPEIRARVLMMYMPVGTSRAALSAIAVCSLSEWFALSIIAKNMFGEDLEVFVRLLSRRILREENVHSGLAMRLKVGSETSSPVYHC